MTRRRLFAARNEWPCVFALLLISISQSPTDGKAGCGVPSVSFQSYLVDLTPETWPWIGSLRNNVNEHICTAVLISSNTAVSTASCFDYENLVEFLALPAVVIFGSADKRLVYTSYQHASTFDVTLHPGHDIYAGFEHDIAILQLHIPVEEFTSYVSPICVNSQEKEIEVFTHCKLAGWGWADDLIMPDDLQSTSVSITSHSICVDIYGVFDKQSFLCVEPSTKICSNDPGSPLMCKTHEGRWTLVGLSSYETEHCDFRPVGYTRISSYVNFIQANEAASTRCTLLAVHVVTLLLISGLILINTS